MNGETTGIPPLPIGIYPLDSRRIAALREKRGWTQETLAERSGLSVRTIRNLELGVVQNPRRSSVDLLAHALGVEVQDKQEQHRTPEILGEVPWRGTRPPASPVLGDRFEHERLTQAVRANRLATFVGTGGIGKTRLALHVAAGIAHSFRHGVAVVELADLVSERHSRKSQAAAVMARVRRQLRWGLPGSTVDGDEDLNLLLVLDNAEHVPDGVTAVARELVSMYPGVRVLVTARRRITERLGVNLEIGPLPAAATVELVLKHVGTGSRAAVDPHKDLPLVSELCRRLGGVPRHLEFAAERMRTIPVQQLLGFGPRMEMLRSNDHALPPHQRSVADSIRWDVDLLGDEHGRLLARIAALPTSRFTLDDVVAEHDRIEIAGADPLTLLTDLHETSLIQADPDDRYRYRLAPFVADVMDRMGSDQDELARRPALAS